ncbi:MAG: ribonuclease P protein component [Flavobacteriales bacterium]|nr:ribonuclease P protein component [Flavobacteriales bacterium]|tara:strand:+ start:15948 stop:16328 length:381 start_codon:yes stop_codon:yes gene_type:complete
MKLAILKDEKTLSRKSINNIYKTGQKLRSKSLTIIWINSKPQSSKIKLVISVPKKNIKKAVDRNYLKRIIRESYKTNKPFINDLIQDPIKIIIIYNKTTLIEFNKLEIELLTLFEIIYKKQDAINQ